MGSSLHIAFGCFLSGLPAAEVVFITEISGSAAASHCRWSLDVVQAAGDVNSEVHQILQTGLTKNKDFTKDM